MSFDLSQLHIVVSRNPLGMSRADTTRELTRRGAVVQDRVDSLTSFVLTTSAEASKSNPTSKVAAAKKGFTPIVTDVEWNQLSSRPALLTLLSSKGFTSASASATPATPASPAVAPQPSRPAVSLDFAPVESPFTTCI
jgi:hypothetical protein